MAAHTRANGPPPGALFLAFTGGVDRFHSFERLLFSLVQPHFASGECHRRAAGTFALMANLGALVCGTWFPFATGLFNNAAWFLMLEMGKVSEWCTRIPGSYLYVRAPSWIWVGIYYGVLVLLLSPWMNTTRKRIFGGAGAVLIAAVYFACGIHGRDKTELTVLPLNGGHAIFVDAGRDDCLIDCGSADAVNFTVKPFLQAHAVNSIPRLVLTEGDSKNCGGAGTLDSYFGVREMWTSAAQFRSPVYKKVVASFDAVPSRHKTLQYGDTFGSWRVLWPDANSDSESKREDDNALVLMGNFNGRRVLLLSDLGPAGQKQLLSGINDLHADIVITGLPNDGEPLSDALADAIQPKLIVIADSEYPRPANAKLRKRLEQRGVPVLYTSDSGAVKIVLDKSGWKYDTALKPETIGPQIAQMNAD